MVNRNTMKEKYSSKPQTFNVSRVKTYKKNGWYIGVAKEIKTHSESTYRIIFEVTDKKGNKYKNASFWLPKVVSEDDSLLDGFWNTYGDMPSENDIVNKKVNVYIEKTKGNDGMIYHNVVDMKKI